MSQTQDSVFRGMQHGLYTNVFRAGLISYFTLLLAVSYEFVNLLKSD